MKVFFAQAINAVAGELSAALIDKEPVLIGGFCFETIFGNIDVEQPDGFGLQFNLTEAVAFAQDREGLMVGIEVVEVQGCDFSGPGAGVIEQLQEVVVTHTQGIFKVHCL